MNHAPGMGVRQGVEELVQPGRQRGRVPNPRRRAGEWLPVDELHHDIGLATLVLPVVEEAHDGRVVEARDRPRLAPHPAPNDRVARLLGADALQGHPTLADQVAGQPDPPEAPRTELTVERVPPGNDVARLRGCRDLGGE